MSARRALRRAVRRRRSEATLPVELRSAPVFWGRIGSYEAVCRSGMLLLLAPEPTHPSLRARSDA